MLGKVLKAACFNAIPEVLDFAEIFSGLGKVTEEMRRVEVLEEKHIDMRGLGDASSIAVLLRPTSLVWRWT